MKIVYRIIYKDHKFYDMNSGEPVAINPEHEGLTALDVCEALCFCPYRVLNNYYYYTRLQELEAENAFDVYTMDSVHFLTLRLNKGYHLFLDHLKTLSKAKLTEAKLEEKNRGKPSYSRRFVATLKFGGTLSGKFDLLILRSNGLHDYYSDKEILHPLYVRDTEWRDCYGFTHTLESLGVKLHGILIQPNLKIGAAVRDFLERAGLLDSLKSTIAFYSLMEMHQR